VGVRQLLGTVGMDCITSFATPLGGSFDLPHAENTHRHFFRTRLVNQSAGTDALRRRPGARRGLAGAGFFDLAESLGAPTS